MIKAPNSNFNGYNRNCLHLANFNGCRGAVRTISEVGAICNGWFTGSFFNIRPWVYLGGVLGVKKWGGKGRETTL